MTRHVEVMDLVAQGRRGTFVLATVVHQCGDRGQGRRGHHSPRRDDRGGDREAARGAVLKAARDSPTASRRSRSWRSRRDSAKPGENRGELLRAEHAFEQGHSWIFVEPVLPHLRWSRRQPGRAVAGRAARQLGYHVTVGAGWRPVRSPDADMLIDGYARKLRGQAFCRGLDAGQGRRSRLAGRGATEASYRASSAAAARWRRCAKLIAESADASALDRVSGPGRSISAPSRLKRSRCRSWRR